MLLVDLLKDEDARVELGSLVIGFLQSSHQVVIIFPQLGYHCLRCRGKIALEKSINNLLVNFETLVKVSDLVLQLCVVTIKELQLALE
jgi:hypothetical protein